MSIAQSLIAEMDHEVIATRKEVERSPDDKWDWKPHPKSFALGALVTHIVSIPGWGAMTVTSKSFDMAPPDGEAYQQPKATTSAEAVAILDESVASYRAALEGCEDEAMFANWQLLKSGQVVFEMPRIACLRSMIHNHLVHHRAQLGVYLRLLDVPVPMVYGPSADEGGFG